MKAPSFDGEIVLDGGDYEAHFKTDGTHAWGDWNALPPDDAAMWGMTVVAGRAGALSRPRPGR